MLRSILTLVLVVLLAGCETPLTKPDSWAESQIKTGGSLSVWNYTAGERQCRKINDWYYRYRLYVSPDRIDDVVFQYISPELKPLLPFYMSGFKTAFRGEFKSLPDNEKQALIQSILVSCADHDIFDMAVPKSFPDENQDIPAVLAASRDLLNYNKDLIGIRGKRWRDSVGHRYRGRRKSVGYDRYIKELEERAKEIDELSAVMETALAIEENSSGASVSPLFRPGAADKIRKEIEVIRRMWMREVVSFLAVVDSARTIEERFAREKRARHRLKEYTTHLPSIYYEYGSQELSKRVNTLSESIKSDYVRYFREGRFERGYNWKSKYLWLIKNIEFNEEDHPKNDPGILRYRSVYLSQKKGFSGEIARIGSKADLVRFVEAVHVPEIDGQISEWKLVEARALKKLNELDADRGGSGTRYVEWPDNREIGIIYLEEMYDVLVKMSMVQEVDDSVNFVRLSYYLSSRVLPKVRNKLNIELSGFKDRIRSNLPVPLDHPVFAKYGITGKKLPRFDVSDYHGRKILYAIYFDIFNIDDQNRLALIAYSRNFADQIRKQCGDRAFSHSLLSELSFSAIGRMIGGEISDFKRGWRSTFGYKIKQLSDISDDARSDGKMFLRRHGCRSPVSNILFKNYRSVIERL